MKKNICAITGARSEFGVFAPILKKIELAEKLHLQLLVTGMHLSKEFGYTIQEIIEQGFSPADTVEMMLSTDTLSGMGKSIGLGIISLTDSLSRLKPDLVLVIGDRFETFAATTAAMALGIPLAHISGGEITEGAIDEQMRHAITKMSHIHFVATTENGEKVRQMGEEPWRVHVVGGPWVDTIRETPPLTTADLSNRIGLDINKSTILVTFHPETLHFDSTKIQIEHLLKALEQISSQILFTYPNADAGGGIIIDAINTFVKKHPRAKAFQSLGSTVYLNLLKHVKIMVGNSSSGMVESQTFKLPVVNIGTRQSGRLITENIICVPADSKKISQGIYKGLSQEFIQKISTMKNPFDQGGAANNIVHILSSLPDKATLLHKKFNPVTVD